MLLQQQKLESPWLFRVTDCTVYHYSESTSKTSRNKPKMLTTPEQYLSGYATLTTILNYCLVQIRRDFLTSVEDKDRP